MSCPDWRTKAARHADGPPAEGFDHGFAAADAVTGHDGLPGGSGGELVQPAGDAGGEQRPPHPGGIDMDGSTGQVPESTVHAVLDALRQADRHAQPTATRLPAEPIWCEIVALACELLAWTNVLAFTGTARPCQPKRLRLRILSVAGRLVGAADGCGSASPPAGHGPVTSRRDRTPADPRTRLTSDLAPAIRERTPAGPWNPPGSALQQARVADRPRNLRPSRTLRSPRPRSRKIQASASVLVIYRENRTSIARV